MLKLAVLVSGGGTNLQAIIDGICSGFLNNVKIEVVISSRENALAIQRAKDANISVEILPKQNYKSMKDFDNALLECLEKYQIELVVLAGFLVVLGEDFINKYHNRIINVHPSLIPAFCGDGYYGLIPHEKALEYGVKITGATVHFVETGIDSGPIILQKEVLINCDDTPQTLQRRVMEEAEWIILISAIKLFADGKLDVFGRNVKIINHGG
jgi:phosphoribosylglycinamide formyltransferase 1